MSTTQAAPTYRSSAQLADHLQRVLVDLIELHLQAKQAHWNVVGHNFRDLHLQLDEIVDAARTFSDQVAERMRALWVAPDGRSATVSAKTSLAAMPDGELDTAAVVDLITEQLHAASRTLRGVHDEVDQEDPTSADILHQIIEQLEKFAWMVGAENRRRQQRSYIRRESAEGGAPERPWPFSLESPPPSR
jgi:starvation-inducible DNA-binding protein